MVFDINQPSIPEKYKKLDLKLKELHSDWKFIEWNDKTVLEFIKLNYNDFLETFLSI